MKTLLLMLCLSTVPAHAQSTAEQTQLGYLATCTSGTGICWFPYTTANPMPTVSQ